MQFPIGTRYGLRQVAQCYKRTSDGNSSLWNMSTEKNNSQDKVALLVKVLESGSELNAAVGQVNAILANSEQSHLTEAEIEKAVLQAMNELAIDTVKKWKFTPAVGPDGKPVAVLVPVQLAFRFVN